MSFFFRTDICFASAKFSGARVTKVITLVEATLMKIGISEFYSYLRMTGMAVLAAGLIGCGGSGGDGGPNIPTASNAAITPPPTTPIAITTGAEATNTTIASAAFQALDGAGLQTIGNATGVVGVETTPTATETTRLTIAEIVRRHAGKIKDHKSSASVTGAQIVQTFPCFVSGTQTFVFDDMNGNASEIFVNCDNGGVIFHGTISSTGVSANVMLGSTVGSPYNISVAATITIDLSITVTSISPAEVLVSQGSLSFSVAFSGTMEDDFAGGIMPGFPTHTETHIFGASLLASDGVNSEQLSNFDLTVVDDNAGTTVTGHFTYANSFSTSAIHGAVTVNITTPIHYAFLGSQPDAGVIQITTSGSPGMIKVTFSSAAPPITVQVYSDTAGTNLVDTYTLTWLQFEGLI